MQPGSEANERQLPASSLEDNIIPYPELIDKLEKLSESVKNPFKSIRDFEATFTFIQKKVEKTHRKNLEIKKI